MKGLIPDTPGSHRSASSLAHRPSYPSRSLSPLRSIRDEDSGLLDVPLWLYLSWAGRKSVYSFVGCIRSKSAFSFLPCCLLLQCNPKLTNSNNRSIVSRGRDEFRILANPYTESVSHKSSLNRCRSCALSLQYSRKSKDLIGMMAFNLNSKPVLRVPGNGRIGKATVSRRDAVYVGLCVSPGG